MEVVSAVLNTCPDRLIEMIETSSVGKISLYMHEDTNHVANVIST